MKFSKTLISTLKNFSTINTGIYLKPGKIITTRSASGGTYAEVELPDGEEIPFDVAIYDLNSFLSILAASGEDSEVTVDNDIIIKGDRTEINWPSCDPSAVVHPKNRIKFPEPQVEFNISGDDYNQIIKISRGLGADVITFTNTNSHVVVNAYKQSVDTNLKKPLSSFEVSEYSDTKDFNFIIHLVNLKLRPDNYRVKLWANGDMFAVRFENDYSAYVISVEDGSEHNF